MAPPRYSESTCRVKGIHIDNEIFSSVHVTNMTQRDYYESTARVLDDCTCVSLNFGHLDTLRVPLEITRLQLSSLEVLRNYFKIFGIG